MASGEVLGQLSNYSLIDFDERTIRLQPLAAGLARERLDEDQQRTWCSVAARAMESAPNVVESIWKFGYE